MDEANTTDCTNLVAINPGRVSLNTLITPPRSLRTRVSEFQMTIFVVFIAMRSPSSLFTVTITRTSDLSGGTALKPTVIS